MEAPIALECILKCESYRKIAFMQKFKLPKCGNVETYFLFEAKDKPVIVFPLTEKNEVIAVKHFRYGANDSVIEVPGGIIEGDITVDNVKKNAKKELKEETGLGAKTIEQVGPQIWFDPASFRVSFFPMLALGCRKEDEPKLEKTEELDQIPPIPLPKWIEMITNQEIYDSKTIAITMMVLCHLYANCIIECVKS